MNVLVFLLLLFIKIAFVPDMDWIWVLFPFWFVEIFRFEWTLVVSVILLIVKLLGVESITWLEVVSPMWIVNAFWSILAVGVIIVVAIVSLFQHKSKNIELKLQFYKRSKRSFFKKITK